MRVIYHPHAEAELTEAAQYYESRVPTLGVQFLDEENRAVAAIREAPERWRVIEGNVRRYLMPRFPYAVITVSIRTTFIFSLSNITVDIPTIGGTEFLNEATRLYRGLTLLS